MCYYLRYAHYTIPDKRGDKAGLTEIQLKCCEVKRWVKQTHSMQFSNIGWMDKYMTLTKVNHYIIFIFLSQMHFYVYDFSLGTYGSW